VTIRETHGAEERDEVTGEWGSSCSSPNITKTIKSRLGWTGHATRMEENVWEGDRQEGLYERAILIWIFNKWDECGLASSG
jgi:hypothetical protein